MSNRINVILGDDLIRQKRQAFEFCFSDRPVEGVAVD